LAYELTKTVHGEEEAVKAQTAARSLFGGIGTGGSIPTTEISKSEYKEGMDIITILVDKTKIASSRGEARRLIQQGGIKAADKKVESIDYILSLNEFKDDKVIIQKGKKVFHQIKLV